MIAGVVDCGGSPLLRRTLSPERRYSAAAAVGVTSGGGGGGGQSSWEERRAASGLVPERGLRLTHSTLRSSASSSSDADDKPLLARDLRDDEDRDVTGQRHSSDPEYDAAPSVRDSKLSGGGGKKLTNLFASVFDIDKDVILKDKLAGAKETKSSVDTCRPLLETTAPAVPAASSVGSVGHHMADDGGANTNFLLSVGGKSAEQGAADTRKCPLRERTGKVGGNYALSMKRLDGTTTPTTTTASSGPSWTAHTSNWTIVPRVSDSSHAALPTPPGVGAGVDVEAGGDVGSSMSVTVKTVDMTGAATASLITASRCIPVEITVSTHGEKRSATAGGGAFGGASGGASGPGRLPSADNKTLLPMTFNRQISSSSFQPLSTTTTTADQIFVETQGGGVPPSPVSTLVSDPATTTSVGQSSGGGVLPPPPARSH